MELLPGQPKEKGTVSGKLEQSFENRTKLQAPCNRRAVSTHDNKELVKPFPFTLYRWSFSGFTRLSVKT